MFGNTDVNDGREGDKGKDQKERERKKKVAKAQIKTHAESRNRAFSIKRKFKLLKTSIFPTRCF